MTSHVALITGAGKGIGREIAQHMAQQGLIVVVADIDEELGQETARLIEGEGRESAFIATDVAKESDVDQMAQFAVGRYGGYDTLVNNAGVAPEPHYPATESNHWMRTLDINLKGVMLCIQYALPVMRDRGGGVIVNIASTAGIGYGPHPSPEYAASKAGVARLTGTLGYLREEIGVRVNCICPGWVETPEVRKYLSALSQKKRDELPIPPPNRLIQPEEIAELVMMFVEDDKLAGKVVVWPDGEPWRWVA